MSCFNGSIISIYNTKCPYLRILYLTIATDYPQNIYFTVQKLQYLHKLELYGVISTHNKYYHIQQLQQLTFFLNELGVHSGNFPPPRRPRRNAQNRNQNRNDDNDNDNDNADQQQQEQAQDIENGADDVAQNNAESIEDQQCKCTKRSKSRR